MIVLSSTSETRRKLLTQAGLKYKTARPPVDEKKEKAQLRAKGIIDPVEVALHLAELKAIRVAEILPGAFVIGADQMLECEGQFFDKPHGGIEGARKQLVALRGKTHQLVSAVVLVAEGKVQWELAETAKMTMRNFSDAFLDKYLESQGETAAQAVGGYQLEGLGAQLFDKIEGDFFTILGLPLIPLLRALRDAGAIPS